MPLDQNINLLRDCLGSIPYCKAPHCSFRNRTIDMTLKKEQDFAGLVNMPHMEKRKECE